jgi:hypothetical protein
MNLWVQNYSRRAKMMKNRNLLILMILTLFFCGSAWAGSQARIGAAGAQELLIPVGGRGIALQGANITDIAGTEAIYWNPAGLAAAQRTEAMFSYMNWIADIKVSYLAVGVNIGQANAVGFSLRTLNVGDIEVTTTDQPEGTGEMFSPTFLIVGATYSRMMTDRIHFGFTTNLITENARQMKATGISFDFGVQYRNLMPGVHLGVALKNLGPDMRFDGPGVEYPVNTGSEPGSRSRPAELNLAKFDLPVTFEIGLGYNYSITEDHQASLYGNFRNFNLGNDYYMGGVEYGFKDIFFLRGGYLATQQNDDNIFGPTFGAGIQTNLSSTSLGFDYTYRTVDYFDANQFFSLRIGF